MKPSITEAILSVKFMEDTVFTLDVERLTKLWLANGHTLCNEQSGWQRARERQDVDYDADDYEDQMEVVRDEEENGTDDLEPFEIQPESICMVIISKSTGFALTSVGDKVKLAQFTESDDQIWYNRGRYLVSKLDGRVLEAPNHPLRGAFLSMPDQTNVKESQLWKTKPGESHYDKYLQTFHNSWYLEVIHRNSLTVGTVAANGRTPSSLWLINYVDCDTSDTINEESGFHEDVLENL